MVTTESSIGHLWEAQTKNANINYFIKNLSPTTVFKQSFLKFYRFINTIIKNHLVGFFLILSNFFITIKQKTLKKTTFGHEIFFLNFIFTIRFAQNVK